MDNPAVQNPNKPSSLVIADMEFINIPAGRSIIGSHNDRYAYDNEFPQQNVKFDYAYAIAKFPVTNRIFAAFVAETNFKTGAEALGGFVGGNRNPKSHWRLPDGLNSIDGKEDHPVVQINWAEASEFILWLNGKHSANLPVGTMFRLPTELEWERAARGEDGRIYPWGNEFSKEKCNIKYELTQVDQFSPVGDSPWGVADMSGNVWEWTHTLTDYSFKYPYRPQDGREAITLTGLRVIRGGGLDLYVDRERTCRCACRDSGNQPEGEYNLGFRVEVAPPLEKIISAAMDILSRDFTLLC